MTRPKHLVSLAALAAAASALAFSAPGAPAGATARPDADRGFAQTNLVSDIPGWPRTLTQTYAIHGARPPAPDCRSGSRTTHEA
jgi:hypothetical protein